MSKYGHNTKTQKKKGWNVKEPVVRADSDPKLRVNLTAPDFDKLIEQQGVNFKVFRTSYCPNVKSVDGGEHEIDCALCNGSGFIDADHICVKGFIQNQELERMLDNQGGQFDGNSVLITFPIGVELQYFTRVELVDFTDIYFQRVLRKPGSNVDILKYKACRVNFVKDKNGVDYYQDQDYKLDANGNILWLDRKPVDNLIYTIHYECHVQYRATKAMHVSRFTQYKGPGEVDVEMLKYPEQWLCTKEFMLRRRDINTGGDLLEGPFDNHTNTTGDNT